MVETENADELLLLGLDVGGTSSRALLTDAHGRTVGTGHAGGGNPNTHPPDRAVEQVARATRTALAETAPERVSAVVLGMAGISKLADPAVAGMFEQAWHTLGLRCPVRTVSDSEVAFAAGTAEPDGTVLIAGTGSIVTRIIGHRSERTLGGYGWLLGDEGSAFWLGREAVSTALRALDLGEEKDDPLVASVLNELLPGSARGNEPYSMLVRRIVALLGNGPPVRLAELAPLVTASAAEGGGKATEILSRAARTLAADTLAVRDDSDSSPIVLAGSLLSGEGVLDEAVRAELRARSAAPLITAGSGAAGAAWLAAIPLVDAEHARELHGRLLGGGRG
ncbi:BadF-type ATPase [Actinopolyspora xinjiangensis]|uniref:BadF-type ATPase n=1 Tax=Actinopolyspora xinjiangensis TaxID=405564 RepID=A0A1H0PB78_9ACTN|nr:BadF/BadG/BcrA/BcrD ATPase family protein [Actinopolyspora xinjiangensis]SDP01899.1 BadF-type ATPase [Actinopolyspora xinjiangensis]